MEPNFPSIDPYAHYYICRKLIMVRQNDKEHSPLPLHFSIPFRGFLHFLLTLPKGSKMPRSMSSVILQCREPT